MYIVLSIIATVIFVYRHNIAVKMNLKYKEICKKNEYDLVERIWVLNLSKIIVYTGLWLIWPVLVIYELLTK